MDFDLRSFGFGFLATLVVEFAIFVLYLIRPVRGEWKLKLPDGSTGLYSARYAAEEAMINYIVRQKTEHVVFPEEDGFRVETLTRSTAT